MNFRTGSAVALVVAGALTLLPPPVSAHDDGLTCHEHPSHKATPQLFLAAASGNHPSQPGESVFHAFENLAGAAMEEKHSGFTHNQYLASRRGLSEFWEMMQIVSLLVVHAERADSDEDRRTGLALAQVVFDNLPISSWISFDAWLPQNREGGAVVVSIEPVIAFLRDGFGMPDSLAAILQGAAEAC